MPLCVQQGWAWSIWAPNIGTEIQPIESMRWVSAAWKIYVLSHSSWIQTRFLSVGNWVSPKNMQRSPMSTLWTAFCPKIPGSSVWNICTELASAMQDLKEASADSDQLLGYRQDTIKQLNMCWMLLFRQLKQVLSPLTVMGAMRFRAQRHLLRSSQFQTK